MGSQAPEQTLAPIDESPPSPLAATMPATAETAPVEEPSPSPPAATIPAMAATGPVEELPPGLPAATTQLTTESESGAGDQERWRALAEQVSMQVLQRLDLFTDTGLKDQLAQRLKPIVERASAEVVVAITQNVGRLVRTYVSEAIEREIAQWKRDQH